MTLRAGDLSQHFDFEKDSLWLCQIVFVMSSSRTGTMISAYVRIDARTIKTLRKFRMKMRLNVHSTGVWGYFGSFYPRLSGAVEWHCSMLGTASLLLFRQVAVDAYTLKLCHLNIIDLTWF